MSSSTKIEKILPYYSNIQKNPHVNFFNIYFIYISLLIFFTFIKFPYSVVIEILIFTCLVVVHSCNDMLELLILKFVFCLTKN